MSTSKQQSSGIAFHFRTGLPENFRTQENMPRKVKGGSKDLIAGKRELDGLIKGTDFENLDLLPADFSFRNLDLVLDAKKKPTQQLKKLLKPLAEEYDYRRF